MVFHVAGTHGLVGDRCAFKLGKDLLIGLTHDIGQYVQPATVRHADHHFLHTKVGGSVDDGVQRCNGGLSSFQRKPFLADVFGMQELFKHYALVQFLQDAFFLVEGNRLQEFLFHGIGQEVHFLLVRNILEFDTYMARIAALQKGKDVLEFYVPQADQVAGIEFLFHILLGQAKKAQIQVGTAVFTLTDGVSIGDEMTLVPIAQDQAVNAKFFGEV